jgi:hypothetical protein
MDVLRARAFLDLVLGKDSRLTASAAGAADPGTTGGFAGRATLTVPLATLLDLADRPGEIPGIGPIDPWLARDLADAAARNPRSTWCVTLTDQHGHAIGHGCARPGPARRGTRERRAPPGFMFSRTSRDGPPTGYGTWRLRTPGPGPDLTVTLHSIRTDPCEHRFEARGNDPGVKLRHCPRSGMRRAPRRCAGDRPPPVTLSTTRRTRRAGGRACVTAVQSADMTTGSSSSPGGRWIRSRTARSGGPRRPGGATTPSRPGTRSNRPIRRRHGGAGVPGAGNSMSSA